MIRSLLVVLALVPLAGCARDPARGAPYAAELNAVVAPVAPQRWALRLERVVRDADGVVIGRTTWPPVEASPGIPVTHDARIDGAPPATIRFAIEPTAGGGRRAQWSARLGDGHEAAGVIALPATPQ